MVRDRRAWHGSEQETTLEAARVVNRVGVGDGAQDLQLLM
jgi:adhesin HecA-like repeat protein